VATAHLASSMKVKTFVHTLTRVLQPGVLLAREEGGEELVDKAS